MTRVSLILLLLGAFLSVGSRLLWAQNISEQCAKLDAAIVPDQKKAAIVPEILLSDWEKALPCLVKSIQAMKPRVNSDTFSEDLRAQFMSVTAALRSILSRLATQDKAANNNFQTNSFIMQFRDLNNLDVVWVLAYGLRNADQDVRLNSLLILANVIDNGTLCVPLDHLHDPDLRKTIYGRRGRANLLSIISVVAPWAYKNNFQNIQRAKEFVASQVANDELSGQTRAILANIGDRLATQDNDSNKSVPGPPAEMQECKQYTLRWATSGDISY